MKKFLLFSLLALVFTVAFCDEAYAQKKKKKKKSSENDEYFDESGFANKLWYGGNFNLGFGGDSYQSQFVFGVSPMVGYKLIGDVLSVGPRVGFEYNHFRFKNCNTCPVYKVSPLAFTAGVFARIKPFANFFAHFEYEYENTESLDPDNDGFIQIDPQTDEIITDRVPYDNVYIGAGYHSGAGLWGYEILLLYNVNQPDFLVQSPFDIRFGITYKF